MNLFVFLVWLQMSAQPQTRVTMYESMCRMPNLEYGERYRVFSATDWLRGTRECHIFERNVGEVYWRGPHGEAILFPIGSPLDDITRAEFSEAAQRAADETDGKLQDYHLDRWYWYDPSIQPHEPWTEPVDVPAVQEQQTYKTGESSCKAAPECEGKAAWTCGIVSCKDETESRPITTCADKSRILEHDENSPPRYWCRKVQP